QRQAERPQRQPLALAGPLPAPAHRAVFVVAGQHLARGGQSQRRRHQVDRHRDVGGEQQPLGRRAPELRQPLPGVPQQGRPGAQQELRGGGGEGAARLGGALKDRPRRRAERAGVQVHEALVQEHRRPRRRPVGFAHDSESGCPCGGRAAAVISWGTAGLSRPPDYSTQATWFHRRARPTEGPRTAKANLPYPPSPEDIPDDFTAPSQRYKNQVTTVVFSLVVFLFLYFALMFASLALIVYSVWTLTHSGHWFLFLLKLVAIAFAGLMFLFLVKNLFRRLGG